MNSIQANEITCNSTISACEKGRQWQQAFWLLGRRLQTIDREQGRQHGLAAKWLHTMCELVSVVAFCHMKRTRAFGVAKKAARRFVAPAKFLFVLVAPLGSTRKRTWLRFVNLWGQWQGTSLKLCQGTCAREASVRIWWCSPLPAAPVSASKACGLPRCGCCAAHGASPTPTPTAARRFC